MTEKRRPPETSRDSGDSALWERVAKTVKPLPGKQRTRKIETATTTASKPAVAASAARVLPDAAPKRLRGRAPPAPPPAPRTAPPPRPLSHGDAPGVDRRAFARARRARIVTAAELDLHGLSQRAAHAELERFIADAVATGIGRVRIITGKGLGGPEARGVLRDAVPRWLNEAGLREWVQGFDYAAPEAGGLGALIVLLRKAKARRG